MRRRSPQNATRRVPRAPTFLPSDVSEITQNFRTHRRWNPLVHFVLSPLFLLNIGIAVYFAYRAPSFATLWAVAMAVGLWLLNFTARAQATRVQDRVIRLEMRLRLASMLAPELAARAHALSTRQFVALRFASDAELPRLVERCLAGELDDGNAIKREIRDWQPDLLRA